MTALLTPLNSTNVRNSLGTTWLMRIGAANRPIVLVVQGERGAGLDAFAAPLLAAGYQVVLCQAGDIRALDAVVSQVEADGVRVAGFVGHALGAEVVASWLARTRRDARAVLIAPPIANLAVEGVRAAALVIDDESGIALARAWPGGRFSLSHDGLRDASVALDAADFIARRVVFAPPPAPGAAAFGAPAPLY